MKTTRPAKLTVSLGAAPRSADEAWVPFRGGELEGVRPRARCAACRARQDGSSQLGSVTAGPGLLCFLCYRAELDRQRALKDAAALDTASEDRFQWALPFEPVDRPRLERLRAERAAARVETIDGLGRFEDRRRRAQLAARRAIQRIAAGVDLQGGSVVPPSEQERRFAEALHAAQLQLPESWLPFVAAR